jgi:hypothetical protein
MWAEGKGLLEEDGANTGTFSPNKVMWMQK